MAVKDWTSELPWGCPKIKLNGNQLRRWPPNQGAVVDFLRCGTNGIGTLASLDACAYGISIPG